MNVDAKILNNISKLNIWKDHKPQSSCIYSRVTRIVQNTQINVIHHIKKSKDKSHMIISLSEEKEIFIHS